VQEVKYYTYVLRSIKTGRYYIGQTGNLSERIKWHNDGLQKSTKGGNPWELVYCEEYDSRRLAMKRERFLKSGPGRKVLKGKLVII